MSSNQQPNKKKSSILRTKQKTKKRKHITFASNIEEATADYDKVSKKSNEGYDLDYDSDDDYNSYAASGEIIHFDDKDTNDQYNTNIKRKRKDHDEMDDDDTPSGDHFIGEETKSKNTFSLQNEDNEYPIEPFNLNEERTSGDGYFDGDTYVFRKKVHDDSDEGDQRGGNEDSWLDDTSLHSSSTTAHKIPKQSNSINEYSDKSILELYEELVQYLEYNTETVTMALQRLGKHVKNHKNGDEDILRICKRDIDSITDITNAIIMKPDSTDVDIYQRSKLDLLKLINPNTTNQDTPVTKPAQNYQWYYKGNQDKKLHGPFTTQQMMDWKNYYGYFVNDNVVDVCYKKSNGDKPTKENDADDLMKDLMDDDEDGETNGDGGENWIKSNEIDFEQYL